MLEFAAQQAGDRDLLLTLAAFKRTEMPSLRFRHGVWRVAFYRHSPGGSGFRRSVSDGNSPKQSL